MVFLLRNYKHLYTTKQLSFKSPLRFIYTFFFIISLRNSRPQMLHGFDLLCSAELLTAFLKSN